MEDVSCKCTKHYKIVCHESLKWVQKDITYDHINAEICVENRFHLLFFTLKADRYYDLK